MKSPRDIISIEIMMLDDEKHVLKEAIELLYKERKITLLTVRNKISNI
tara:strand:+ start:547 stop:690 length:144 start_codon:yes stop_codon:yes gene_type:complete